MGLIGLGIRLREMAPMAWWGGKPWVVAELDAVSFWAIRRIVSVIICDLGKQKGLVVWARRGQLAS